MSAVDNFESKNQCIICILHFFRENVEYEFQWVEKDENKCCMFDIRWRPAELEYQDELFHLAFLMTSPHPDLLKSH